MEESGKEKDPLGILPKETAASNNSDPLGILKKKSPESTPSTSVSEGGTSGLTATPSASPNTPTETYGVKPGSNFDPFAKIPNYPGKTALGNIPKVELGSISSASGGLSTQPVGSTSQFNAKTLYDNETKKIIDSYDNYKVSKSTEQIQKGQKPFASDDSNNTIDFYLNHLKQTDPSEYKYVMEKQLNLSEDRRDNMLDGDDEDVKEDDLMLQKTHADIIKKAFALKVRLGKGKEDVISNTIKENYSDVLRNLNESSDKLNSVDLKINGINEFMANNFEVDENGQLITTPLNRKTAEDMIGKLNELSQEKETYLKSIEEIRGNKDFNDAVSLLDETQKTYDDLEKTYYKLKSSDPEVFKGLPEYKKKLEDDEYAKFSKEFNEAAFGGSLGVVEGVGQTITKAGKMIPAITKLLGTFSSDDGYKVTDKLYDVVSENIDDFNAENIPLPSGYDKPVYDSKTGEYNLQYLPGKLASTIVQMAPIVGVTKASAGLLARAGMSGELATAMGSFTGEYLAAFSEFYDEAKLSGLSEKDALSIARTASTFQGAISAISPDVNIPKNIALFKDEMANYAKKVADGVSPQLALKETAKAFAKKAVPETIQENIQSIKEVVDKNEMYRSTGVSEKINNDIKKTITETTVLTLLTMLSMGGGSVSTPSRSLQEAMYVAANEPENMVAAAKKLLDNETFSQEKYNDVIMKVAKANFALSKIDKSLPAEKKIKALIPLMEKLDLKEEAANLDDSQKELMNEKIAKKDAEIKGIVSSPSDEEIQDANEAESFFNRIKEQHTKDNTPEVKIPAEENKMQKEGLFEVDDSQKSQPIELSTQPENVIATPGEIVEEPKVNEKDTEAKIAEINKAIKENKQNFFNEKIDNNTYWKNQDALEKDLANLENPAAKKTETLTPEEVIAKETPTTEGVKPLEPEVKAEEAKTDVPFSEMKKSEVNTEPFAVTKKVDGGYQGIVFDPKTKKETVVGIYRDEKTAGEMANQMITDKKSSKAWDSSKKETTTPKTATQISAEQDMLDEEDVLEDEIPASIKNAKTEEAKAQAETIRKSTSTKMTLDKEAFKLINEDTYKGKSKAELKDLVEKKYIGTLERAYKNKVDGIISGPEYTKYRNELNDIVTGKLAEYSDKKVKGGGQEGESLRKGELKAQVSALGEKVKEKLLGQGFKNVALSSAVPITPKMIEDLVNLTVKGVHLGIDLGYGVREATARAMTAIKSHPKYQQVINSGMSEKDFVKSVNAEFSKAKSDYVAPVVVEETTTEKPLESTTSEKTAESTGSAPAPESETTEKKGTSEPKKQMTSSEFETGETAKRKVTERLEGSEKYNNILASMKEEDKSYNVMKLSEIYDAVKKKINEFERAGKLSELAIDLLDPKRTDAFPPEAIPELLTQLADRFNSIADEESNEFVKQELYNLAAELMTSQGKLGTTTGKTLATMRLAAERMPTSKAGLKAFVNQQMNNVADASMSEKNKAERDAAVKELVDLQVKEKLSEIAEGTKGKDQVAKIKTELSSLKIDLKDC